MCIDLVIILTQSVYRTLESYNYYYYNHFYHCQQTHTANTGFGMMVCIAVTGSAAAVSTSSGITTATFLLHPNHSSVSSLLSCSPSIQCHFSHTPVHMLLLPLYYSSSTFSPPFYLLLHRLPLLQLCLFTPSHVSSWHSLRHVPRLPPSSAASYSRPQHPIFISKLLFSSSVSYSLLQSSSKLPIHSYFPPSLRQVTQVASPPPAPPSSPSLLHLILTFMSKLNHCCQSLAYNGHGHWERLLGQVKVLSVCLCLSSSVSSLKYNAK